MEKDKDMNANNDRTYLGATLRDVVKPAGVPDIENLDEDVQPVNRVLHDLITKDNYKDVPPLRWFVPGWVTRDATTAIYGEPGAGKSFWSLSLSLAAASGGQWATHDFKKPHRVLYLAPEAAGSHTERVRGWASKHGTEWPETFYLAPTQVNISTDQAVAEICNAIDELAPIDLLVLDTLASASAGVDENGSQMTSVTENIETIRRALPDGAAMLIVHHTGKDQTKGLRGHSSLNGYVTNSMLITKDSETNIHRVEGKKVRDGSTPLPQYYRIDPEQLPPIPLPPNTVPDIEHLTGREIGVMVPVDYLEAVQDTLTMVYDRLAATYALGDMFGIQDVRDLTELGRGPLQQAMRRGLDKGLWQKQGAGRTTRYKFIGRAGDFGAIGGTEPADDSPALDLDDE
jgi:hypothetical protein